MADALSLLDALREREPRVALATLVAARGSVPRGEGAKMLVGMSGRILGTVTIGGCVDARVVEESARVLASGRPSRVVMDLGDDDAMALGLTCGGTVELVVEPVEPGRADDPVVRAAGVLAAHAAADREAACVVRLDGRAGRLVVGGDGSVAGSLGDALVDAGAVALAQESLQAGTSRIGRVDHASGDEIELFAERYAPPETLVLFGASEVAVALARMAALLGWRSVVADARERWATRERFPRAAEIRVGMLGEIAHELRYGARTAVVLLAHDYKFELPVLRAVLAGDAAYVGLLGNRRRVAALLDLLLGEGVSPEQLARVHAPVGLDIGARSPEEIALAVAAEVLAVLRGRTGGPLRACAVTPPSGAMPVAAPGRHAGA